MGVGQVGQVGRIGPMERGQYFRSWRSHPRLLTRPSLH